MGPAASRAILARVSRPRPLPEPDLDAEQEVDLRSAWSKIAARWWLPVLGLVLGLVAGYLLALGGGQVYRAETLVYLGVPVHAGRRRRRSRTASRRTRASSARSSAPKRR